MSDGVDDPDWYRVHSCNVDRDRGCSYRCCGGSLGLIGCITGTRCFAGCWECPNQDRTETLEG